MPPFDYQAVFIFVTIIALVLAAVALVGVLRKPIPETVETEAGPERDLTDYKVRDELTGFLRKQGVVGNADIRNGIVLSPITRDDVMPLATVLANAGSFMARLPNPAACSLYVRESQSGQMMLLSDLDLDHIVDAARVMQSIGKESRK